jgi:hypothetical protein
MSLDARSILLSLSCLPLALASCSDNQSDGDSAVTLGNDEVDTSGDSDTTDDTTTGDGDTTDDTTEDDTTGDGDACGGGPGCYPSSNSSGAGLSSLAPLGCGSGPFTSTWVADIAGGGAIDAAKSTPLAADFDGDDDIDILIAARKTFAPQIYPGNGDGTFGSPTSLPGISLFVGGWGLDAADLDSDGMPDIAIGDHTEGALAWLNSGALSFAPFTSGLPEGNTYSGSGLGDIDGDLDFDLVLGGDQFGGGYHVVKMTAGSWEQTTPAGIPPLGDTANRNVGNVQFADYDDDGDMDMFAIGQPGTGGVAAFVYENAGDGTSWTSRGQFGGGSIQSLGNPVQGALGDVNCDGNVDIAAGGTVHLGDGAGNWTPGAVVDPSDISQLGDMNGDGWLDIVTHSAAGLQVYLGDGSGTAFTLDGSLGLPDGSYVPPGFVPQTSFEFTDAYGLDLADVDGNDNLDIVRSYKIRDSGVFGDGANENILEVWVR